MEDFEEDNGIGVYFLVSVFKGELFLRSDQFLMVFDDLAPFLT
jgi:hypothetical protein